MAPRKRNRKQADTKFDLYQHVTDSVIAKLEEGVVPWRRPWRTGFGDDGLQRNLASRKAYRGINQFTLSMMGFDSPYWLSFKQIKDAGGTLRKGERSELVVFWRFLHVRATEEDSEPTGMRKRIAMLRYFRVFNLDQCDGITAPAVRVVPDFEPLAEADTTIANMPSAPQIRHRGDRACYSPGSDIVTLPHAGTFHSPELYYHTAFHELAHSTGHESRLSRPDLGAAGFGSQPYAREELVAEMTAAMVERRIGLNPELDVTAAYVANWLQALKDDRKLLISAAGLAQHAADWICNDYTGPQTDEQEREPEPAVA